MIGPRGRWSAHSRGVYQGSRPLYLGDRTQRRYPLSTLPLHQMTGSCTNHHPNANVWSIWENLAIPEPHVGSPQPSPLSTRIHSVRLRTRVLWQVQGSVSCTCLCTVLVATFSRRQTHPRTGDAKACRHSGWFSVSARVHHDDRTTRAESGSQVRCCSGRRLFKRAFSRTAPRIGRPPPGSPRQRQNRPSGLWCLPCDRHV